MEVQGRPLAPPLTPGVQRRYRLSASPGRPIPRYAHQYLDFWFVGVLSLPPVCVLAVRLGVSGLVVCRDLKRFICNILVFGVFEKFPGHLSCASHSGNFHMYVQLYSVY